ncbi:synaptopodin [Platysternon megacephalum]|uniref:Synaptopodin n=1 Tax=Platysternon megacephalum TaxID=55544 RepID=A0A4D9DLS4_9SAUR|nr:synaptopodin [Platysternon megacephalum]
MCVEQSQLGLRGPQTAVFQGTAWDVYNLHVLVPWASGFTKTACLFAITVKGEGTFLTSTRHPKETIHGADTPAVVGIRGACSPVGLEQSWGSPLKHNGPNFLLM